MQQSVQLMPSVFSAFSQHTRRFYYVGIRRAFSRSSLYSILSPKKIPVPPSNGPFRTAKTLSGPPHFFQRPPAPNCQDLPSHQHQPKKTPHKQPDPRVHHGGALIKAPVSKTLACVFQSPDNPPRATTPRTRVTGPNPPTSSKWVDASTAEEGIGNTY